MITAVDRRLGVGFGSFDPDAWAYLSAAGITDPAQQTAVNDLVVGLKDDGLYSKMVAIWPFVGGTAAAHKYNLIDPQDLDTAFRLVFVGSGHTHNANGWTATTSGHANTFLIMSDHLTVASAGATISIGGGGTGNKIALGSANNRFSMLISTGSVFAFRMTNQRTYSNNDEKGVYTCQKYSSGYGNMWKNGVKKVDNTWSGNLPLTSIYLNAMNTNNAPTYSDHKRIQGTYIHQGLTDLEVQNLHSRIDAFENALGRKTW